MELQVRSSSQVELIDITDSLTSNITEGVLVVYTPHTTTGVFINENDSALFEDIRKFLEKAVPQGGWKHDADEGNADAHLRRILLGSSVTIPVTNGKLDLGTWQHVFFYEGNGPRNRRVIIKQIKS